MNYNNYETVTMTTERLVIKKGMVSDFLKVYEYNFKRLRNVDGICKLEKQDLSKIKEWFKGGIEVYYSDTKRAHMFDWIIYINDVPIGNIVTIDENSSLKSIEISYNLHPSYWGNGYMKEAVTSVMDYLFKIGYDNIFCTYSDGNMKAKRVVEKLGFKPYMIKKDSYLSEAGHMIDDYKTVMTKESWLSRTQKIIKHVKNG